MKFTVEILCTACSSREHKIDPQVEHDHGFEMMTRSRPKNSKPPNMQIVPGKATKLFSKWNVLFCNTTCKQLGLDICYDLNWVQGCCLQSCHELKIVTQWVCQSARLQIMNQIIYLCLSQTRCVKLFEHLIGAFLPQLLKRCHNYMDTGVEIGIICLKKNKTTTTHIVFYLVWFWLQFPVPRVSRSQPTKQQIPKV